MNRSSYALKQARQHLEPGQDTLYYAVYGRRVPPWEQESPENVAQALLSLSEREINVLVWRLGLMGHEPETYEQIGRRMGLNRERPRQIEAQALHKLRHQTRRCWLTHPEWSNAPILKQREWTLRREGNFPGGPPPA